REIGSLLPPARIAAFLAEARAIDPADHFHAHFGADPAIAEDFDRVSVEGLDARANYEFVKRLQHSVRARAGEDRRVNVAGFFDAPTGMGESARSLRATLAWTPAKVREMSLPHPQARRAGRGFDPLLFGWPQGGSDLSISVANADCADMVEAFLPRSYRARRNVAFWVWETEELPARFQEAERLFDEVWTPSRHSAAAIARTISRPVRVLHHTLDFDSLARARPARPRYGLPERGTIFGFAFDPMSALERKNVRGLVRAFREAFRDDDDCWLALKVNGGGQGSHEYEAIRAEGDSSRVLFLEGTLDREETFGFIKSLDAYVSLHRAEGFGLTCAEAMALALPVIATGYSGNLEFMDADNSLLVPARVVETDRPWGPYPAGSRWAEPDARAAVHMMRSLKDPQLRESLGRAAAESVRARLDPKALGAAAWKLIGNALERADAERA
ncbi:MAG: glycosyltransferase, partial [Betaproteobacteria bacterium]